MSKVTVPSNAFEDAIVVISRAATKELLAHAEREYGWEFRCRYIGWCGRNRKAYFIADQDEREIYATWDSDTSLHSPPQDFRRGSRHHRGILRVLRRIAERENDQYMLQALKG